MEEIECIYVKYGPLVYEYLYEHCKDRALAEEVTQEAFFRIILRCRVQTKFDLQRFFKRRESIQSQICRFAYELLKREASRTEWEQPMDSIALLSADTPAIEYLTEPDAVHQVELMEVQEKVRALKRPMRDVISLRYYNKMTYKEVAVHMNQGENWVKHMLRLGKENLKQALA